MNMATGPTIAESALAIPYGGDGSGAFMGGDRVAKLVARPRVARRWARTSVALMDGGICVARGVCVPFASTVDGRDLFPDAGWDQVAIWAAEDALDDRQSDTLSALEIAVHPAHQRQGLSARVLDGMIANARALGYSRLIAPVRPPRKGDQPNVSMHDYALATRTDGLPVDPWLRVHIRAGGRIVGVAPCSATVVARLDAWRRWTGLPFRSDGEHCVPGALVPVIVSLERDLGIYVEPNVWVDHSLP
jgi:GNAT superfamily N-acetyltransferase